MVYGRLRVNQYVAADGKNMTSVEVDAHGVGHDLTRGQSLFSRPERSQYDVTDRLADPNIQAAMSEEERDRDEPQDLRELDGLEVGGGFDRTVEDADTDPYVVTTG